MAIARFLFCTLAFSLLAEGLARVAENLVMGFREQPHWSFLPLFQRYLSGRHWQYVQRTRLRWTHDSLGRSRLFFPLSHASMLIVLQQHSRTVGLALSVRLQNHYCGCPFETKRQSTSLVVFFQLPGSQLLLFEALTLWSVGAPSFLILFSPKVTEHLKLYVYMSIIH